MAVSAFFKFPILNLFSGIQKLHTSGFSQKMDPNVVRGYMKEVRVERLSASRGGSGRRLTAWPHPLLL